MDAATTSTVAVSTSETTTGPVAGFHAGIVMEGLGLALALLFGWLLWAAHKKRGNGVDLAYLLVDPAIGKVTLAKFGGLLALISSTWVLLYLAVSAHFDATFASAYMLTWGAVKVAADFTNKGTTP